MKNKYEIKYGKKVLVWIAISPKGMTEPFFRESALAINRYVYRDESLDPYLLPFIKKYHRNESVRLLAKSGECSLCKKRS